MRSKLLRTTNSAYASLGLLILRIAFGALLLTHGFPKLMKLLEGNMQFGDPLGLGSGVSLVLAVFAEFLCSILVIFGVFTRLATIPIIITMSTAAFIVHADDPFSTKEKALLFLFGFLCLLFTGSGKYSVDNKLN
ncbi:MAG: DoxX family protein [Candidatus Cyclobacteriaceae bacterium M2_1C_046]